MASFNDALKNRLGIISQRGEDQSTWEQMRNARQRQQTLNDQALAWQQAQLNRSAQNAYNMGGIGNNVVSGGNNPFEAFVRAISQKESGGNYKAVNRSSGALGKYQIMPSNIRGTGGWDRDALGYDVSTTQFLNSPDIQEKVARYQLQKYYQKYGPAGASIAWYAGPSAANKYVNTGYVSSASQGIWPSISQYMNSIVGSIFR